MTTDYKRPELTAEDRDKAEAYARATFRKYGIGKVVIMVAHSKDHHAHANVQEGRHNDGYKHVDRII